MDFDRTPRLRGRALQERNDRIKRRDKVCVIHRAKGLVAAIDEIDHIIPLFKGGPDTDTNLQGLCRRCHDAKTITERGDRIKPRDIKGLDWVSMNTKGVGGSA